MQVTVEELLQLVQGLKAQSPSVPIKVPVDILEDPKPEDLIMPENILDQFTDREWTFMATPYFDEMQAEKELKKEQLKQQENLNG